MQLFKQKFDDIKKSSNPETINDFLIKLSKSPNIFQLKDIPSLEPLINEIFIDKTIQLTK